MKILNKKSEKEYTEEIIRIMDFFEKNYQRSVKFSEVMSLSEIGENNLKKYFKNITGVSVMHYFKKCKIQKAKAYIETGLYSFTEISQMLGYDSIHYFSRQFKTISGMSPTEYKLQFRKEH